MAGPTHSRRLFLAAAALLLFGAAFLRLHQIDRRPFHADEGVQAYQTWQLLRGEGYAYDPADKHGPFLYYAAAGIAKLAGWTPAALNETKLRSVTLLAGLGTLALILAAGARLGHGAVLIGAALLAAAPLAIIYDTYFVQEAWFCFFTWALFFATMRWWGNKVDKVDSNGRAGACAVPRPPQAEALQEPSFGGAVFIGTLAGLMQATKETSVIHFAALGVAVFAARRRARSRLASLEGPSPDRPRPVGRRALQNRFYQVLAALCTAALVYVLFYSSFFTRWAGVTDGLRTYFNYAARASGSAHDQPWSYYFSILWSHTNAGIRWGEPLLLFLAVAGAAFAFSPRANSTQRALAVFTIALLLVYGAIPYKTPWLLLTQYVGLTLLAGLGAVHSAAGLPAGLARFAPLVLGLIVLGAGVWRNFPAIGRYASDDRNPYVYQPTSSDLARLVTEITALPAEKKIAVISPDHAWPLPWYLRDRAAIGYFAVPPANPETYDLVLYDSRLDSPLAVSFAAYGLRPNVILWGKTDQLGRN